MTRDDLGRRARALLHPVDFHRAWFRELQAFYRHLSREEFWLRYDRERQRAAGLWALGIPDADVYAQTDYYILRQMYYHRDRSFHTIARATPPGAALLEFGCGVAPVTAWLRRRRPDVTYCVQDLPEARTSAFAQHRFRGEANVLFNRGAWGFDVIVCLEVMEHLPSPLKAAQFFAEALLRDGHLFIDFVQDAPGGGNGEAAQTERESALALLATRLETRVPITDAGPMGHYRKGRT